MKKSILLTLLCLFVGSVRLLAADVEKAFSHYVTVGKSIILNPFDDCGLKKTNEGAYNTYGYTTSYDFEELVVTSQLLKGFYYNSRGDCMYKYTLTPLKVGVSIFTVSFQYQNFNSGYINPKTYQVTYTINAVDVTSISIPSSLSLTLGESYTYSPVISHPEAETTLTWSSSNPAIVSVDETGTITGNQEGEAVIYCTAENGVMAQSTVTVRKAVPTAITMSSNLVELGLNNYSYLTATIEPEAAAATRLSWTSSNENVVMVGDDGLIVGLAEGWSKVTATTTDGTNLSANCMVHVVPEVATTKTMALAMKLVKGAIALQVGGSVTLAPLYQPLGVTTDEVTWSTSDPAVATVDTEGTVTPLAEGEAIITATSKIDAELSAECRVKVFEGDGGGVDEGVSTDYGGMFSAPARRSVFDVQGHRLPEPRKGAVNIIGGNKVYVK